MKFLSMVVLIATVLSMGCDSGHESQPSSGSTLMPISFGSVRVGDCKSESLSLVNHSNTDILITSITGSNDDITLHGADLPLIIPAKDSAQVVVEFCPLDTSTSLVTYRFKSEGTIIYEVAVNGSGFGTRELAMDAMRANVAGDGNFLCEAVSCQVSNGRITLVAQGDNTVNDRRFELVIPRQINVPYTIDVASDETSLIYYCLPLTSTTCKNFFADVTHGGSGTITVTHIDNYVAGTFNGMVTVAGGNETRTITNGEFKARY